MRESKPPLSREQAQRLYESVKPIELNDDIRRTMRGDAEHFRKNIIPEIENGLSKQGGPAAWRKMAREVSGLEKLAFLENRYYEALRTEVDASGASVDFDALSAVPQILHILVSDLKDLSRILAKPDQYESFRQSMRTIIERWPAYESALLGALSLPSQAIDQKSVAS